MIEETVSKTAQFKPKSVFLYGSQATGDTNSESDYEVGLLFNSEDYVSRGEIHKALQISGVSIYPFRIEELKNGTLDTPFQKTLYIRELIECGKTIAGERIVENLPKPEITILDLIEEIRFDTGVALAAMLSQRNGDMKTASNGFCKSCLFGLRCLVILEKKEFPVGYSQIYKSGKDLVENPKYIKAIEQAYGVRNNKGDLDRDSIFSNLSLLSKYIENKLHEVYKKDGDIVVLVSD